MMLALLLNFCSDISCLKAAMQWRSFTLPCFCLYSTYVVNLMWLLSSKNEPQWLEYFKLIFLEMQNVTIQSVLLNLVTNIIRFFIQ